MLEAQRKIGTEVGSSPVEQGKVSAKIQGKVPEWGTGQPERKAPRGAVLASSIG